MQKIILTTSLILLIIGCKNQKFLYNLKLPDQQMELASTLNEISGMEMLSDSLIASVQDEKGEIYFLDINTGNIVDHFGFGKKGDYEGIAHHKKHFYVLRSDGSIFKVKRHKDSKEYPFKNNNNFDFEGLCVDQANNQLLVACKLHGDKKKRDFFYVYAFSLEEKKYEKKPVFKIERNKVDKDFKPSGIAIHPNGNIYILSSFSKSLLVLSPKGEIRNHIYLNESIFHQPEGITFNSNGDLYISNEKKDQSPTILRFKKKSLK